MPTQDQQMKKPKLSKMHLVLMMLMTYLGTIGQMLVVGLVKNVANEKIKERENPAGNANNSVMLIYKW